MEDLIFGHQTKGSRGALYLEGGFTNIGIFSPFQATNNRAVTFTIALLCFFLNFGQSLMMATVTDGLAGRGPSHAGVPERHACLGQHPRQARGHSNVAAMPPALVLPIYVIWKDELQYFSPGLSSNLLKIIHFF
jgi:hypothetical protein